MSEHLLSHISEHLLHLSEHLLFISKNLVPLVGASGGQSPFGGECSVEAHILVL